MTAETSSKAKSNILTAVLPKWRFFCAVTLCLATDVEEDHKAVIARAKQSKTNISVQTGCTIKTSKTTQPATLRHDTRRTESANAEAPQPLAVSGYVNGARSAKCRYEFLRAAFARNGEFRNRDQKVPRGPGWVVSHNSTAITLSDNCRYYW